MERIKQNLKQEALVLVAIAAVAYIVPRLIHKHLIGRIGAVRNIPEVSDIAVILLGAGLLKGTLAQGVITGAGISFLTNVLNRLGVDVPRIRGR